MITYVIFTILGLGHWPIINCNSIISLFFFKVTLSTLSMEFPEFIGGRDRETGRERVLWHQCLMLGAMTFIMTFLDSLLLPSNSILSFLSLAPPPPPLFGAVGPDQFQTFRKLSHEPVHTHMPSSGTPVQLTLLSCPDSTPRKREFKENRADHKSLH